MMVVGAMNVICMIIRRADSPCDHTFMITAARVRGEKAAGHVE